MYIYVYIYVCIYIYIYIYIYTYIHTHDSTLCHDQNGDLAALFSPKVDGIGAAQRALVAGSG